MKIALLLSLFLAADITVEVKVKGNVATLVAETDGKTVLWIPKSEGLTPAIPPEYLAPKVAALTGTPGTYKVLAITSIKDEPKVTEITFTLEGPPQPPQPPLPPDPLVQKVKDAYARDPAPLAAKSERAAKLVGLYTVAVKVADDQTILTVADMLKELNSAKTIMGIPDDDVLREIRLMFSQEIVNAIGPPSVTPLNREAAKVVFTRLANALKKV